MGRWLAGWLVANNKINEEKFRPPQNQKSPFILHRFCVCMRVWCFKQSVSAKCVRCAISNGFSMLLAAMCGAWQGGYASLVITFLSLNLLFQIKVPFFIPNWAIDRQYMKTKQLLHPPNTFGMKSKTIEETISIVKIILQTAREHEQYLHKNTRGNHSRKKMYLSFSRIHIIKCAAVFAFQSDQESYEMGEFLRLLLLLAELAADPDSTMNVTLKHHQHRSFGNFDFIHFIRISA